MAYPAVFLSRSLSLHLLAQHQEKSWRHRLVSTAYLDATAYLHVQLDGIPHV